MAITTYNTSLPVQDRYLKGQVQISLVWNSRNEHSGNQEKLNSLSNFLWRQGGARSNSHLIHSIWVNFQTSMNNTIGEAAQVASNKDIHLGVYIITPLLDVELVLKLESRRPLTLYSAISAWVRRLKNEAGGVSLLMSPVASIVRCRYGDLRLTSHVVVVGGPRSGRGETGTAASSLLPIISGSFVPSDQTKVGLPPTMWKPARQTLSISVGCLRWASAVVLSLEQYVITWFAPLVLIGGRIESQVEIQIRNWSCNTQSLETDGDIFWGNGISGNILEESIYVWIHQALARQIHRKLQKHVPYESSVVDLYAGSIKCVEINKESKFSFEKSVNRLPKAINGNISWHNADASIEPLHWLEGSDVVVVDPPRKGLHPSVIDALRKIALSQCTVMQAVDSSLDIKVKDEKRPWVLRARAASVNVEGKTTLDKTISWPSTLVYISCGWESFKEVNVSAW
ncbi:hypothetical protein ZIOFF_073081 [Zingiber officinale]|uniref:Uncharacterized protein n=1 Tax=Zingiber officinale TaxID=94328 RepID=A0A8J5BWL3_ZINOF|nr:hypothetical protein ZIOFF_073081 [Zingiber officinale]